MVERKISRMLDNLPVTRNRTTLDNLMNLMSSSIDEYVKYDLVLKIGKLGDSRALSFLMNRYVSANLEEKKRILLALQELKDPRSIIYLEKIEEEDLFLKELLKEAIVNSKGNRDYEYEFCGPLNLLKEAKEKKGKLIRSYSDLLEMNNILKDDLTWGQFKPQTYVVVDSDFLLGGYLNEHVDVASGRRVRAAGEAGFEFINGVWRITYLNNRSNGYLPHSSCYPWVDDSLRKTEISFPSSFTETFPKD